MNHMKILGLLAVAAATLMAFAATASATTLTSPTGTSYTGEIHATSGETTLHGVVTVTCNSSTVAASIQSHGSSVTVSGAVTTLSFSDCNQPLTVELNGSLIVHTDSQNSDGNATVTSNGMTILIHTTLGTTCNYRTEETDIGTLTSSHNTGGHAILDVDAVIFRHTGSIFCGSNAEWTGQYTITTPSTLYVH
jgi:hypothetical protein